MLCHKALFIFTTYAAMVNGDHHQIESRDVRPKYIGSRGICDFEKLTFCNEHNPKLYCLCYIPAHLLDDTLDKNNISLCSEILRIDSLQSVIITIGISFPVPVEFITDSDSIFTEDLEFFTNIDRNSIIIMRKGCRPDRKSFEFQFGVLKKLPPKRNLLTIYDLEILNSTIFTSNLNFMEQNGIVIDYVIQTDTFRPFIGHPEWYNKGNNRTKQEIGRCSVKTKNPQYDCYFYELGLLFFLTVYIIAGAIFWITIALFKIIRRLRHAPSHALSGNANGKLEITSLLFKSKLSHETERTDETNVTM